QQEGRPDPDEGAAARHGLYPGRLFAHRHETCLSHLYSFVVPRSVRDLCERRRARFADPDRTRCADRIHAGRNGRLDPERGVSMEVIFEIEYRTEWGQRLVWCSGERRIAMEYRSDGVWRCRT